VRRLRHGTRAEYLGYVTHADLCYLTAMSVEWAKTKARADRWCEEVLLITEEMRRVICFLEWKAGWWTSQSALRVTAPPNVQRGIAAYAAKQAAISRSLAQSFAQRWHPILTKYHIPVQWPAQYVPVPMDLD
jgi:hypothetical protein